MSLRKAWVLWRNRREAGKAEVRAAAFWTWFAGVADELRQVIAQDRGPGGVAPGLSTWIDELNRRTTAYHPLVRAVVGARPSDPSW